MLCPYVVGKAYSTRVGGKRKMADIYCNGEPGTFPDREFRRDKEGRLKAPYIHETAIPHYITGEAVDAEVIRGFNIPGLPGDPSSGDI
jgi:hypothetical protein